MIPPRFIPPGVLQLYEVVGEEKVLIEEMRTSPGNRNRINQIRNDLLMLDPTRNLILSENNAFK